MEERYRHEIEWWFAELGMESEVDRYVKFFPELKTRLSKYAIGILLWEMNGYIELTNSSDVIKVRKILYAIDNGNNFDNIGNTFDDLTPCGLCELLGVN